MNYKLTTFDQLDGGARFVQKLTGEPFHVMYYQGTVLINRELPHLDKVLQALEQWWAAEDSPEIWDRSFGIISKAAGKTAALQCNQAWREATTDRRKKETAAAAAQWIDTVFETVDLDAWDDLCDRNDCACLIVGHNGKNVVNKSAVNMALGSVDIPASMRSIIHLIENPDDPSERLAIHIKCSNAPKGKTLAYGINDMGGTEWHGFSDFGMEDLNAINDRKKKPVPTPYEKEPLVQVFNQLITDRPGGGFWSYADLKSEGAAILGFPPFGDVGDLRKKLDSGLARELQKNDGLIVTHGEKGSGNARGIRIRLYTIPQGYQTKIQES